MGDRISVLLPTYNRAHLLPTAIESVLNQSHKPFEIIICDDCSIDGTKEVIRSYMRRYPNIIKPIFQKKNRGIPHNLNSGLKMVEGDYISLMADDDYYLPRKLELELKAIQQMKNAHWAYSGVDVVDTSGKRLRSLINSENAVEGNIFKEIVLRIISPRHYLMSVEAQREVGFFDERLMIYEDWDFKIRLSKFYKAIYVPEVLTVYHVHSEGIHCEDAKVHFELMKMVIDKTSCLLEDLPNRETEEIKQELDDILLKKWVSFARNDENKRAAFIRLWNRIIRYPRRPLYYKLIIMLVFPSWLYDLGVRSKRQISGSQS